MHAHHPKPRRETSKRNHLYILGRARSTAIVKLNIVANFVNLFKNTSNA